MSNNRSNLLKLNQRLQLYILKIVFMHTESKVMATYTMQAIKRRKKKNLEA